MRRVVITRGPSTDQGTFGALVVEQGDFTCVTGELPDRKNERRVSCIPPGAYPCKLIYSPRFKRKCYHVLGVQNRENILIHSGNLCGDESKGFVSQVEGCILLGDHLGTFEAGEAPAGTKNQKGVTNSAATVCAFIEEMEGCDFQLIIQGQKGSPGGY